MMYPYITFPSVGDFGDLEITHSQLLENDGIITVEVHFERTTKTDFNSAKCELPSYKWLINDGFTDKEIEEFESFLKNNAHVIFKFAERGGNSCS